MLNDLRIPAGVYKNGTTYQAKGRFFDCNLVRWYEGTIRPLGGWREYRIANNSILAVAGAARGAHAWRSNGNETYGAIGTHTGLYAFGSAIAGIRSITPLGFVPGFVDNNVNTGYGGGAYGLGTYGTPRSGQNITDFATTWSMDNFGEFLVAVSSDDGRLLVWDLLTQRAEQVIATAGTVPLNNSGVIVTDERFVFLLQANGNRRLIAWGDQESLTNWQVTATTQAGDFELQTSGAIQTAKRVRGQTLILTTTDAHVANYIGAPLVYGFERVGTGCGCISPNAAVVGDKFAMWMGDNNFFLYDGFVKPVPCEVSDFVFNRLNRGQMQKVWGIHNADFGEITFYYPSGMEVDSYVTFNYREQHWAVGTIARTIGIDNQVFPRPIRVSPQGELYEHEVGFAYDADPPFVRSGPVEMGNGAQVFMAKYLYPDEKTQGSVLARFSTQFYPNAPEYPFGPYQMANPTPIRFTGRQIAMQAEAVTGQVNVLVDGVDELVDGNGETLVEQPIVGQDFRVGVPRINTELGGMR